MLPITSINIINNVGEAHLETRDYSMFDFYSDNQKVINTVFCIFFTIALYGLYRASVYWKKYRKVRKLNNEALEVSKRDQIFKKKQFDLVASKIKESERILSSCSHTLSAKDDILTRLNSIIDDKKIVRNTRQR